MTTKLRHLLHPPSPGGPLGLPVEEGEAGAPRSPEGGVGQASADVAGQSGTRLPVELHRPGREVEAHDVSARFLRRARERFGEQMPLEPRRIVRGALWVSCPSPLWCLELLYSADALLQALRHDLSAVTLRRIRPILR